MGRMRRVPAVVVASAAAVVLMVVAGAVLLRPRPVARIAADPPAPVVPASATPTPEPSGPASTSPPTPPAGPTSSRPPTPGRPNLAAGLRKLPADTRQVIIVHTDGYGPSTATLETFTKGPGGWQPAFGAMAARIGSRGFADSKVEGDLATPTGMYPIGGTVYGIAADPGVRYRYHRLVPGDYWNENPASPGYNSFAPGPNPGGASEALWEISPQYDHLAVINYNIPMVRADPPRGSGIFLHVSVGRATLGCVALARADLVTVLRWLDPAAAPRIVLAARQSLGRY